jgi:hypothetical protein
MIETRLKSGIKEDFGAALRGLRLILGAGNKALSGDRLSELCAIAPGTLNAAETGRRRLSEVDQRRIEIRLGAKWNSKKGCWVYRWDESIPYSREVYEQYVNDIVSDGQNRELEAEAVMRGVFYMLQRLPKLAYIQAMFELHDQLSALAAKLQAPSDVMEVLEYLRPSVEVLRDPKTRKVLLASVIHPDHQKVAPFFTPQSVGPVPWHINLAASPEYKELLKKGPPSRRQPTESGSRTR